MQKVINWATKKGYQVENSQGGGKWICVPYAEHKNAIRYISKHAEVRSKYYTHAYEYCCLTIY